MRSEEYYGEHLSPETIRDYLNGKLDGPTMHRVERHLLDCEFCSDAVEGFELASHSPLKTEQTLLALRKKLNERVKEHGRPALMRWPVWSAAAAGIALAIAGYVVIKQQEEERELMAMEENRDFFETDVGDTLVIIMPEDADPLVEEQLLATAGYPAPSRKKQPEPETTEPIADVAADESLLAARSDKYAAKSARLAEKETAPSSSEVRIRGVRQARGIKGTVTDVTDGRPLPGVSVTVNSPTGKEYTTVTDANGEYQVNRSANSTSLVFALVGMKTVTKEINDRNIIDVAMPAEEIKPGETVIVGYGAQRKSDITGSSEQMQQIPPTPSIGKEKYTQYLADSLRYPPAALEEGLEGEVIVRFTVRSSGRPAAFSILQSLSPECDAEAIRLIREGPGWNLPVSKRGILQPAEAVQSVQFQLPATDNQAGQ